MEFSQQVKAAADIVSVVGEYVRLRKQGPNRWAGLCPFHSEKTPSFSVHEGLQIYKCFGCGKGGDVFKFLMEIQGLSFYEALTTLAERHGIPVPRRAGAGLSDEESRRRAALYQAHEIACELYRRQLESAPGAAARRYFESRGLRPEEIEAFGLGYAPAGGQALVNALERAGVPLESGQEAGLLSERQDRPGRYDRFRNRVIFPIADERGKTVAFAGRAIEADQQPKYLNSPETPIYKKSYLLYNLHRAREGMRRTGRAVLVEGYTDVIGVARAGTAEAVASCGTALTAHHARLLRRHAGRVIVNFDPDAAGQGAAERSIQVLLEEGLGISVLTLPENLDPYDYVNRYGAGAYRRRLDAAPDYFTWLAERARQRFDVRTAEGRVAAFEYLVPSVRLVPDKLKRASLADELAERLGIERSLILEQFKRLAVERATARLSAPAAVVSPGERLLMRLLTESAEARAELLPAAVEIAEQDGLPSAPVFRALAATAGEAEPMSFSAVEGRLEDAERRMLTEAVFGAELESLEIEAGRQAVEALRRRNCQRRLRELRRRIAEAEKSGDRREAVRLVAERQELERGLAPPGGGRSAEPRP